MTSTGKRLGVLISLLIVMVLGFGQSAFAASWGYLGYNSWNWYGCKINAGAVLDPNSSGGRFAVIGGGAFTSCSTRHNFEVFTQEQFSPGGSAVYNLGAQVRSGQFTNSYGMPTGNILETARICGYTGYWRTAVDVQSNGNWSGWLYSDWHGPVKAC